MNALKSLACPLSPLRINGNAVRITGLMMATMIALYALTGNVSFLFAIVVDYFIRAATLATYSPFSWLATKLAGALSLDEHPIDKAPKIFAARVGFLFAFSAAVLYFIHPMASLLVALTLLMFALLESVLDLCMGCIVYSYVVLPLFHER